MEDTSIYVMVWETMEKIYVHKNNNQNQKQPQKKPKKQMRKCQVTKRNSSFSDKSVI